MQKKPKLFIIAGPSGIGKSTAVAFIAKKIKTKIFATDKIRRSKEFKNETGHYQKTGKFFPKKLRRKVYKKLIELAEKELTAGQNVILDATFSNPWMWQMAEKLADRTQAKMILLEITYKKISPRKINQRLEKRFQQDKLAARPEIYWHYKNHFQSYEKKHFIINNDGTLAELKKRVNKIIKKYEDCNCQ